MEIQVTADPRRSNEEEKPPNDPSPSIPKWMAVIILGGVLVFLIAMLIYLSSTLLWDDYSAETNDVMNELYEMMKFYDNILKNETDSGVDLSDSNIQNEQLNKCETLANKVYPYVESKKISVGKYCKAFTNIIKTLKIKIKDPLQHRPENLSDVQYMKQLEHINRCVARLLSSWCDIN
jgi:hypothetical protein